VSSTPASPPPPTTTSPTTTPAPATTARDLAAVRAELQARQAALGDLATRERSLVDGLGALDESLAQLHDELYAAEQRLRALTTEIATLQRVNGRDEHELRALQLRLKARLRQLAVDGEGGAARALLGAEGFTELALRRRLLRQLADNDSRLVGDVRRVEATVAQQRVELRARAEEAAATRQLIADQTALVTVTRDERARTLERVRGERAVIGRAAKELAARHRGLQALLSSLAAEPRPRAPAGRRGMLREGLPWPVAEGVIIRDFGSTVDPTTGAEVVSNGLELRSAAGTDVYAVADGRVVHTGWLRGFGRVVILDHEEGHHTLSAHLQRATVGVGDVVARGQVIGVVGDTESHNGPKLYFELRERGRPRDPAPFLKR
jgi:septal ring factor EnvC (AmiA/AmiB activator)